MQPGLPTLMDIQDLLFLTAEAILMDRLARKAANAPPKVINLIPNLTALAQGTTQQLQLSATTLLILCQIRTDTRVNLQINLIRNILIREVVSIRFSQNAKLLSPQGLFISLFTPVSQQISLQYLAPSPSA